jgi:histidine kinase 2/3/4 (cytokinin receptor)
VFLFWLNKQCVLQDTFAKYTARTSFERTLLNGVAYAQRVFHHEREMFESQQGWIMNTMQREPAPPRDEYAPVIFFQDTVSYLARIDMMSGEVRLLLFDCSLYIHWCVYDPLMSL